MTKPTQPKPGEKKGPNSMTLSITTQGAIQTGKAALEAQRQKPKEDKP